VAMVQRLKPDVLVMDLSMPVMDGAEATKELVAANANVKILILTMHSPDEALIPMLESGASGFLEKNAADRELVDAVRAVAHGDTYIQPSAARVLAGGTDEEIWTWCGQNGRRIDDVDAMIWNGFAAKRGWRDDATPGLERNKAGSGLAHRAAAQPSCHEQATRSSRALSKSRAGAARFQPARARAGGKPRDAFA